jgi:hypothetical protein
MFGRRRVIEAEKNLAVKQANAAVANQNYIASLEKTASAAENQIAALEAVVEKGETVMKIQRNRIAALENLIATLKDLSGEQAKEGLEAAYKEIEDYRRILASA